jgi:voltage-gated potassium channel
LTGFFRVIKAEYIIVGVSIVVVVLMGAFSMRAIEGGTNETFERLDLALWFAAMTIIGGEPIGGEPQTTMGRLVTVFLMMGGLTLFAVFTGTISAVMVNSLRSLRFRSMEIDELDNHAVICGWNRAGKLIIDELIKYKTTFEHVVLVCEKEGLDDDPYFRAHLDEVFVVMGDYTRIDVLREAGIERASCAMLLADSTKEERTSQDRDARTVLAAMLIEKINARIYTVVQLLNRDNETSLRQVGVEEIIVSDEYVGNIMATVAGNRGIVSVLDELLTAKYGHHFHRCIVPRRYVGRTVGDILVDLKRDYDATLIGVDIGNGSSLADSIKVNPPMSLMLETQHHIIVAAKNPITE